MKTQKTAKKAAVRKPVPPAKEKVGQLPPEPGTGTFREPLSDDDRGLSAGWLTRMGFVPDGEGDNFERDVAGGRLVIYWDAGEDRLYLHSHSFDHRVRIGKGTRGDVRELLCTLGYFDWPGYAHFKAQKTL